MYKVFEQLCKEKHVSAYKVSKETGVHQSTLSDWKRGKATPKVDKLQKIADYFNVPVSVFFENEQKEIPADKGSEDEDDDFVVLARHMKKIPEKERQRIIKNFRETVDMYLEVMGITDDKDKEGK
ncbi:MAG: helix-turn-helix domain-containing protein [Negativibacillus sp.]